MKIKALFIVLTFCSMELFAPNPVLMPLDADYRAQQRRQQRERVFCVLIGFAACKLLKRVAFRSIFTRLSQVVKAVPAGQA